MFANLSKKIVFLGVMAALSMNANAAVYSLGSSQIPVGAFTYTFDFTVGTGEVGSITGKVDSFFRSNGATKLAGFDITDILLSAGTLTKSETEIVTPLAGSYTTTSDSFSFFNNALAAGTYTITVLGTSYKSNASFAGGFELVTSPVPEPQTTGMIALGLGLIGLISLRKKQ